MRRIHYIVNYAEPNLQRHVRCFESVNNKVEYILSVLSRLNYDVFILSTLEGDNESGFISSEYGISPFNYRIKYIATCGCRNILYRLLTVLLTYIQLFSHLIKEVKEDDIILVYHSYRYIIPLKLYRFFSKKKILLELEEIYSVTWQQKNKKNFEENFVRNVPNAYILINDVISKRCNLSKPGIVCYGNYSFSNTTFNGISRPIHIVYGGLIKESGDAFLALELAFYLNSNYQIHIAGYGDVESINLLLSKIKCINNNLGYDAVIYEGNLSKDVYYQFLKKCSLGLCIKSEELSKDADYYYPSKILIYLGNGVLPICNKLNSVLSSDFSTNILFVDSCSLTEVAEKIKTINWNVYSNLSFSKYDLNFCNQLKNLLINL